MRVIVVGSKGMLAQDLIPLLTKEHETFGLDQDQVDIKDKERVFDLIGRIRPDLVVNCAAYNHVDQAETDRDAAFRVNGYGVQYLALACQEFRSVLCHFSTDYVFDGKSTQPYQPHDQPNPISVYGESKRAGEVFVQSILDRYYLIRTSSLYGRHGQNFVYTILQLAQNKKILTVVDDQIMSPTWTLNLAQGVVQLIRTDNFGLYHLTDRTDPPASARPVRQPAKPGGHKRAGGGISWLEFAEEILRLRGLSNKIVPTTSEQLNRPAKRPAYSVLDTMLFTQRSGYEPILWQESLKRFMDMI